MKPGDIVTIYCDPLTRESIEGRAKLLEIYRPNDGDGLSMWIVEFIDDGFVGLRTVYDESRDV
jgi:hypothetical protein